jgi:xylulose-5-phosphate/fructose-6-phosphate phosphoketolase
MASAGDIPTQEALAAIMMLREAFPDLKIRYINVVDLLRLQPRTDHPHGLSDIDFDLLFTTDKPIIFNFHGYPWLIHRLTYSRTNHQNLHAHGYREKGNINTPFELAIENEIDRYTLAMDAIKYVPRLRQIGSAASNRFRNEQIACRDYAFKHGIDRPDIVDWRWPHEKRAKPRS